MIDIDKFLNELVLVNFVIDDVRTKKGGLKQTSICKAFFFNLRQGFSPNKANLTSKLFSAVNFKILPPTDKIHLKPKCNTGFIKKNGKKKQFFLNFNSDKPPGFGILCEPVTEFGRKTNKFD